MMDPNIIIKMVIIIGIDIKSEEGNIIHDMHRILVIVHHGIS